MLDAVVRDIRTNYVEGYTNRCKDGKYIIMLDYDRLNIDWVIPELRRLQMDFNLSDFYIFKSSEESYHAVCFDKVNLSEYVTILKNSTVDINYINVPLRFGSKVWTLRVSPKNNVSVEYCFRVLTKEKHIRAKSSAHIQLVEGLFKGFKYMPDNHDYKLHDELKEVLFARYPI